MLQRLAKSEMLEAKRLHGWVILLADEQKSPAISGRWKNITTQTEEELLELLDRAGDRASCWGPVCGLGDLFSLDIDWAFIYGLWNRHFGERAQTLTYETPNLGARPFFLTKEKTKGDPFESSLHTEFKQNHFVACGGHALNVNGELIPYKLALDQPIKRDDKIIQDTTKFLHELLEGRYNWLQYKCIREKLSSKKIVLNHKQGLAINSFMLIAGCEDWESHNFRRTCYDVDEAGKHRLEYNRGATQTQIDSGRKFIEKGGKPFPCKPTDTNEGLATTFNFNPEKCEGCVRRTQSTEPSYSGDFFELPEPGEPDGLPFISKNLDGGVIIALEDHGYYLDIKHDKSGWSFKIDDRNDPKGPHITPWKTVNKVSKLETSRLTKRIRGSLKEITRNSYEDALNRILQLLEVYNSAWENKEKTESQNEVSVSDLIVQTVLDLDVKLFSDQFTNPYIVIPTKNPEKSDRSDSSDRSLGSSKTPGISHIDSVYVGELIKGENAVTPVTAVTINKTFSLSSRYVKRFISALMWEKYEAAPKSDHIKSALLVLGGMAQANEVIKLYNRVAEDKEGNWWLDLSNEKWEAVKITDEGWSIESSPILFKRYSHQLPLFTPVHDGDLSHLLDYINLHDVNNQLLWLVTQISYLVPGVPHPQSILWGEKGSVKSTVQLFVKMLLDNSSVELLSLPSKNKPNELIQQLDHHYISAYDNISRIDDDQSDILCRAITGIGQSKRLLYSDDQDYITAFLRCVTQNGISISIGKPDLGDRSIVIETKPIPKTYRKQMKVVKDDFISKAPVILGGFLDSLVRARNISMTLNVGTLNRMADFTFWGSCITKSLGLDPNKFIRAYNENIGKLEQETIRSSVIGELMMAYLEQVFKNKDVTSINHTSTKLYRSLLEHAKRYEIDLKDSDFPKNVPAFGKALLNIVSNLPSIGYSVRKKHSNKGTIFTFSKIKPTKLDDAIEYSQNNDKNVWKKDDLRAILRENQPKLSPITQPSSLDSVEQDPVLHEDKPDEAPIEENAVSPVSRTENTDAADQEKQAEIEEISPTTPVRKGIIIEKGVRILKEIGHETFQKTLFDKLAFENIPWEEAGPVLRADPQFRFMGMKVLLKDVMKEDATVDIPMSLKDQIQTVLDVIGEKERTKGIVRDDDIYESLSSGHGLGRPDVTRFIEVLMRDGTIYSPRPGYYKRTT